MNLERIAIVSVPVADQERSKVGNGLVIQQTTAGM